MDAVNITSGVWMTMSSMPSIFKGDDALSAGRHMGVEPKIGDFPPKWMVKIMENPIKNGMIWGENPPS